jgi:integrase
MAAGRVRGNAYRNEAGDGWYYQISIPASLTPDGRRRQEKSRGPRHGFAYATKGKALDAMDRRITEIRAGKISFSGSMTLGEFVDGWYDDTEDELPEARRAKYRYTLRTYVLPWLGQVKLREVADRMKAHYKLLAREGKHRGCCYSPANAQKDPDPSRCRVGKPLAPSSIENVHKVLHAVLGYAVEQGIFVIHPMTKVKGPGRPKKVYNIWTAEQARTGIEVFGQHRLGSAFIVAIMTGLRRGELAGLRWGDVDLDARVIHVRNQRTQQHSDSGCVIVDKGPKADSVQSVPMSGIVAQMLAEHRKRQRREGLANGYGSPERVFVTRTGKPYGGPDIYSQFQVACRANGLPLVRLHDLRHLFGTMLLAEHVDVKIIQNLMGHSSDRVTRDVYLHYLPSMGEQAIKALDDKLWKSA